MKRSVFFFLLLSFVVSLCSPRMMSRERGGFEFEWEEDGDERELSLLESVMRCLSNLGQ